MSPKPRGNLALCSAVVELLVPQRRPMLMVDFVKNYSDAGVPSLEAGLHISANDPLFEGHFPGMPVWPGALTMEGLGQASTVLLLVTMLRRRASDRGEDPDSVLDALRNLDRGFRMHPGYRPGESGALMEDLQVYRETLAVGASVELKFPRPVLPGCRLDYRVEWTDTVGDLVRFAVEAAVAGDPVATGTLTGAMLQRPVVPPVDR